MRQPLPRIGPITGRTDDIIKVRGVMLSPAQVDTVLSRVDGAGPEYQIHVERRGGGRERVTVRFETSDLDLEGEVVTGYVAWSGSTSTLRQRLPDPYPAPPARRSASSTGGEPASTHHRGGRCPGSSPPPPVPSCGRGGGGGTGRPCPRRHHRPHAGCADGPNPHLVQERRQRHSATPTGSPRAGRDTPGDHLLVVDDVAVTGATLRTAVEALTPRAATTLVIIGRADLVAFPEIDMCVTWAWNHVG